MEIPGRPRSCVRHSGHERGNGNRPRSSRRQNPLRVAMLYPEAQMKRGDGYRRTLRARVQALRVKHRHPAGARDAGVPPALLVFFVPQSRLENKASKRKQALRSRISISHVC